MSSNSNEGDKTEGKVRIYITVNTDTKGENVYILPLAEAFVGILQSFENAIVLLS